MTLSDDRYNGIIAGIDKIREEKPYSDARAAVAAMDWIASATTDVRKHQRKLAPADLLEINRMAEVVTVLESLQHSIQSRMKGNDQNIPGRHGGASSSEMNTE